MECNDVVIGNGNQNSNESNCKNKVKQGNTFEHRCHHLLLKNLQNPLVAKLRGYSERGYLVVYSERILVRHS